MVKKRKKFKNLNFAFMGLGFAILIFALFSVTPISPFTIVNFGSYSGGYDSATEELSLNFASGATNFYGTEFCVQMPNGGRFPNSNPAECESVGLEDASVSGGDSFCKPALAYFETHQIIQADVAINNVGTFTEDDVNVFFVWNVPAVCVKLSESDFVQNVVTTMNANIIWGLDSVPPAGEVVPPADDIPITEPPVSPPVEQEMGFEFGSMQAILSLFGLAFIGIGFIL